MSKAEGVTLLVALAIADAANGAGESSCQSIPTVAAMVRSSERTVQRSLRSLEELGEIASQGVDPKYRTTIYALPGVRADGFAVEDPQQARTARKSRAKGDTTDLFGARDGDKTGGGMVTKTARDGDTTVSAYPTTPELHPNKGSERPTPSAPHPAEAVARGLYDGTQGAVPFMGMRVIAKWAIDTKRAAPDRVLAVGLALYAAGKPITKVLVAQVLDGHLDLSRAGSGFGGKSAARQREDAGMVAWAGAVSNDAGLDLFLTGAK